MSFGGKNLSATMSWSNQYNQDFRNGAKGLLDQTTDLSTQSQICLENDSLTEWNDSYNFENENKFQIDDLLNVDSPCNFNELENISSLPSSSYNLSGPQSLVSSISEFQPFASPSSSESSNCYEELQGPQPLFLEQSDLYVGSTTPEYKLVSSKVSALKIKVKKVKLNKKEKSYRDRTKCKSENIANIHNIDYENNIFDSRSNVNLRNEIFSEDQVILNNLGDLKTLDFNLASENLLGGSSDQIYANEFDYASSAITSPLSDAYDVPSVIDSSYTQEYMSPPILSSQEFMSPPILSPQEYTSSAILSPQEYTSSAILSQCENIYDSPHLTSPTDIYNSPNYTSQNGLYNLPTDFLINAQNLDFPQDTLSDPISDILSSPEYGQFVESDTNSPSNSNSIDCFSSPMNQKNEKVKSEKGRKSKFTPEDRYLRKKGQNKEASLRYRQKKKEEEYQLYTSVSDEEKRHADLNKSNRLIKQEIKFMKKMAREILIEKKVLSPDSFD